MVILERFFRALLFFMVLVWTIIVGFEWNNNNESDLSFIDKMQNSHHECLKDQVQKLGGFSEITVWNGDETSENFRRSQMMKQACAGYDMENKYYFPDGKNIKQLENLKHSILSLWVYIALSYVVVFSAFIFVRYTITGKVRARKLGG